MRTSLLSEWHVTSILSKRESLSRGGLKLETTNTQIATLVLRAEPTDTLLKVLSHLLSGQSFELILNAATGTGKLRAFATKLVRFNEANRQPAGSDPSKTANSRALLFDISFLMLCRITQMYGIEVILSGELGGETFFEQWASEWLKPNVAPDLLLNRCDPMLTDQLLKALTSGESDLRSGSVRWHDACFHVPAVIREILAAYESQLVSDEEVERILDTLRTQMCCLSVCAAAWLRFYIQVQPVNLKSKPTMMLDHLMTPLSLDDSKEHYRERSVLMLQIIRRLAQDENPLQGVSDNQDQSLDHQLSKLWNKILNHVKTMAVCIGFIGKENSPLFLRCINQSQELQFHYIMHTCIDFVEEKIIQSNKSGSDVRELYLGLLYSSEEVKAYGFVTNTKIKIVIIIDSTNSLLRDNEIRAIFRKLHNAYTELVCNPFYTPGDPITSK
nr:EOG090X0HN8 [Daphnia lumholtzi]SVE77963.1 EOG090X0HN8 [Daphnia lumholtzi]SVE78592.1 EOG090X0HN8 [Daphnia lumholtzi]